MPDSKLLREIITLITANLAGKKLVLPFPNGN